MTAANKSDPRVYFAAERTLLAWIRTGLTIIALGFVVARFGLFLELLQASSRPGTTPAQASWQSTALGVSLVLLGALAMLAALWNHLNYVKTLPARDVPAIRVRWLPLGVGAAIALLGILLAVYLVVPHP